MLYDVFICHASEDKDDFVRSLAEALRSHHVEVWYDEFTLSIGDSLREAIDRGLSSSRFGIVVLSPSFFQKRWPNRELNGLVARETAEDRQLILPVWHKVNRDDVLELSPPLADLLATSSVSGMDKVVNDLLKKLRPEESPLIIARDFLIEKGVPPPVITDEWWLDIVEIKEAELLWPDLNREWRWIFPLPFPEGHRGRERGLNIAWAALQLDWAKDGKERKICQITHPEIVHAFLRKWPGLQECAYDNPAILALYTPQLTISGFDDGFEDVFDGLMAPESTYNCEAFRYSNAIARDGKELLCGDFIAWRHPTYGNYTASELSIKFVNAHNTSYSREVFSGFECLVWLLSHGANWMPDKLKEILKKGFKDRVGWWITDLWEWNQENDDVMHDALYPTARRKFSYTKRLKTILIDLCNRALHELELDDDPNRIANQFIERGFFEGFHEEHERIQKSRSSRA